ncbi:hypothetical protein VNO78_03919 [Psophocarpus tetragonolobus]|uniref:Uncharacterized protein n=1 Tax=Psophocarpus tetragonolobus TaxID=3891 RepID=A0AAN9XVZ7_PSOTE
MILWLPYLALLNLLTCFYACFTGCFLFYTNRKESFKYFSLVSQHFLKLLSNLEIPRWNEINLRSSKSSNDIRKNEVVKNKALGLD